MYFTQAIYRLDIMFRHTPVPRDTPLLLFVVSRWETAKLCPKTDLRNLWIVSYIVLFRAQEPKAPVTDCDHALSGVCRPLDNLHFRLLFQNRLMDFDETWYAWSTQGPLQVLLFFGQIRLGADPGRAKIGHGGPLLQKTSSPDWKDTATNLMHSNDVEACGEKCCYFWNHSEVKFLTRFDVFLDLVILPYFNAISTGFYAVKCLITIYFV